MGSGKTLYAVQLAEQYARQGRRVVANFKINLASLFSWWERILLRRKVPRVERISAVPSYGELRELGRGGKREDVAGLLILDECALLFNARAWQDRERGSVIGWLLHTRKLGWDVIIIVQNAALIDKQIRVAVIEMAINVRRLDKLKLLGVIRLPRMHVATERYGTEPNAVRCAVRMFRGNRYFRAYNTQEMLISHKSGDVSPEATRARDEHAARRVAVPEGVRAVPCPAPTDPLAAAWFDIGCRLGVMRTDLPEGYLRERELEAREALP